MTECFGPVLGVMRADDLDHAIELQNATPYGLTGGIHSLDEAEVARWLDGVRVGNAYINRGITGAIVQRQPFGGWKRSSVGCGPKAGGPDYVAEQVTAEPAAVDRDGAERSYRHAWSEWFSRSHDPTGLLSERNELRYCHLDGVVVRVGPDTPDGAQWAAVRAAEICSTPVVISDAATESESVLLQRLDGLGLDRVRLLTGATDVAARRLPCARHRDRHRAGIGERSQGAAALAPRTGHQPDGTPSRSRRALSHGCSASAIGVLGGPCTNGHSSSAMRR